MNNKEYLRQEIKKITNRLQLLTDSDIKLRVILLESLRDLQKQYQIYLILAFK